MMDYVEELQKFNNNNTNNNNNLNTNEINYNFIKNHQQLIFPSHLYKKFIENVVFNKDIQGENSIDQSVNTIQETATKTSIQSIKNNKMEKFDENYIRKKFLKEINSSNNNNNNDNHDTNNNNKNNNNDNKNEKASTHWNLIAETTDPTVFVEENNNNNNNLEAKSEQVIKTSTVEATTVVTSTTTTTLPQQGLVNWMSAVMAEHMTVTSGSHHHHHHHHPHLPHHHTLHHGLHTHPDPAVGMNYTMWNTIDGKLNAGEHQHMINQNHKDEVSSSHIGQQQQQQQQQQSSAASLYAAAAAAAAAAVSMRSQNSGNSSPVHGLAGPQIPQQPPPPPSSSSSAHLLVVPHPINSNKINYTNRPANTGRKFKCKMCPQIFNSKADHQHHSQAHMRETKPYKCSQCSKTFANSSYLSQHTRIHLGIKPYRCEICQRKFTQLSHLQQHIRTHTGDKPYKCRHPGCQKAFSQLSNLQSHSRCHQTDKPYKCNSCYKCFTDETSLLEHIPKHKESKHLKTHICQYCGKSYTQETYLSKHMQKHAERPDKRPAIAATLASLKGNLAMSNAPLSVSANDHPYWPKVSPDSAATIAEAMQQQQQNQYDFAIGQHSAGISGATSEQLQSAHHRVLMEHHRNLNGNDDGEDLVVTRQNASNLAQHLIVSGHNPPSSTANAPSSGSGNYDSASITKTIANSAFTPINTMVAPHLNTIGHHQLAQRPYLYDAISFQNKNVNQNASNTFQNQLISLHQIRNYQPGAPGGLMTTEHVLGIGVGSGKDKGQ